MSGDHANADFFNLGVAIQSARNTAAIRAREGSATASKARMGRIKERDDVPLDQALQNVRLALQRVTQSPLQPALPLDLNLDNEVAETMRNFQLEARKMRNTSSPTDAEWTKLNARFMTMTSAMASAYEIDGALKLRNEGKEEIAKEKKEIREKREKARRERREALAREHEENMKKKARRALRRTNPVKYYPPQDDDEEDEIQEAVEERGDDTYQKRRPRRE